RVVASPRGGGAGGSPARRGDGTRGRGRPPRLPATRPGARRPLPRVPRRDPARASRPGSTADLMPAVHLRDIVTEDDVEAVMGLRRGPGQDRYLGSMIRHL